MKWTNLETCTWSYILSKRIRFQKQKSRILFYSEFNNIKLSNTRENENFELFESYKRLSNLYTVLKCIWFTQLQVILPWDSNLQEYDFLSPYTNDMHFVHINYIPNSCITTNGKKSSHSNPQDYGEEPLNSLYQETHNLLHAPLKSKITTHKEVNVLLKKYKS